MTWTLICETCGMRLTGLETWQVDGEASMPHKCDPTMKPKPVYAVRSVVLNG